MNRFSSDKSNSSGVLGQEALSNFGLLRRKGKRGNIDMRSALSDCRTKSSDESKGVINENFETFIFFSLFSSELAREYYEKLNQLQTSDHSETIVRIGVTTLSSFNKLITSNQYNSWS